MADIMFEQNGCPESKSLLHHQANSVTDTCFQTCINGFPIELIAFSLYYFSEINTKENTRLMGLILLSLKLMPMFL